MGFLKYVCIQNENTGPAENITLLPKMSWAVCLALCVMQSPCPDVRRAWLKSELSKKLRRTQQHVTAGCCKSSAHKLHTKWGSPSFSQLPAHLGTWRHPALLNQGFDLAFARKSSSALFFFPQTCYPVVFLVTQHSLISTVTLFSKEVSISFYRCECEAQNVLRDSIMQGAFFCFTSSLQSVSLLFLKARGDAKHQRQWAQGGASKEEKKGSSGIDWMLIACHALLYLSFYLAGVTEGPSPGC